MDLKQNRPSNLKDDFVTPLPPSSLVRNAIKKRFPCAKKTMMRQLYRPSDDDISTDDASHFESETPFLPFSKPAQLPKYRSCFSASDFTDESPCIRSETAGLGDKRPKKARCSNSPNPLSLKCQGRPLPAGIAVEKENWALFDKSSARASALEAKKRDLVMAPEDFQITPLKKFSTLHGFIGRNLEKNKVGQPLEELDHGRRVVSRGGQLSNSASVTNESNGAIDKDDNHTPTETYTHSTKNLLDDALFNGMIQCYRPSHLRHDRTALGGAQKTTAVANDSNAFKATSGINRRQDIETKTCNEQHRLVTEPIAAPLTTASVAPDYHSTRILDDDVFNKAQARIGYEQFEQRTQPLPHQDDWQTDEEFDVADLMENHGDRIFDMSGASIKINVHQKSGSLPAVWLRTAEEVSADDGDAVGSDKLLLPNANTEPSIVDGVSNDGSPLLISSMFKLFTDEKLGDGLSRLRASLRAETRAPPRPAVLTPDYVHGLSALLRMGKERDVSGVQRGEPPGAFTPGVARPALGGSEPERDAAAVSGTSDDGLERYRRKETPACRIQCRLRETFQKSETKSANLKAFPTVLQISDKEDVLFEVLALREEPCDSAEISLAVAEPGTFYDNPLLGEIDDNDTLAALTSSAIAMTTQSGPSEVRPLPPILLSNEGCRVSEDSNVRSVPFIALNKTTICANEGNLTHIGECDKGFAVTIQQDTVEAEQSTDVVTNHLCVNISEHGSTDVILNQQCINISEHGSTDLVTNQHCINVNELVSTDVTNQQGVNVNELASTDVTNQQGVNVNELMSTDVITNQHCVNVNELASTDVTNQQGVNVYELVSTDVITNQHCVNVNELVSTVVITNEQCVNESERVSTDGITKQQCVSISEHVSTDGIINQSYVNASKQLPSDDITKQLCVREGVRLQNLAPELVAEVQSSPAALYLTPRGDEAPEDGERCTASTPLHCSTFQPLLNTVEAVHCSQPALDAPDPVIPRSTPEGVVQIAAVDNGASCRPYTSQHDIVLHTGEPVDRETSSVDVNTAQDLPTDPGANRRVASLAAASARVSEMPQDASTSAPIPSEKLREESSATPLLASVTVPSPVQSSDPTVEFGNAPAASLLVSPAPDRSNTPFGVSHVGTTTELIESVDESVQCFDLEQPPANQCTTASTQTSVDAMTQTAIDATTQTDRVAHRMESQSVQTIGTGDFQVQTADTGDFQLDGNRTSPVDKRTQCEAGQQDLSAELSDSGSQRSNRGIFSRLRHRLGFETK